MATAITDSPNITSLDSKIVADLCGGNFLVDVSPSVFLPGGASTSGGVQGASVKITNPLGVVIRNYITSGFDIYPPMTSVFSFAIPLIAGNYQYGTYTIDVRLTDHDGTNYYITKTVNICPPDPNNKTKKEGCLNASINGNCVDGKVVVLLNEPPNYKATAYSSQIIDMNLYYPTESELSPIDDIAIGAFSVKLYEGEYKLTGTTCVLYDLGDNVFIKVKYKISCSKIIKCVLDKCCIQAKLDQLSAQVDSDCTFNEKQETMDIILLAQFYVSGAEGAANCGLDPSGWISKLEALLGCTCTCNCNVGTPIINSTPTTDFSVEGCNVDEATVGNTKIFTINNYRYQLVLDDTNNLLSLTPLALDGCTYKQHININAANILAAANIRVPMFRALLTQTSTSIPTAVNSTINTITAVYTRVGAGEYVATFTGLSVPLTAANCFVQISPSGNVVVSAGYNSANSIYIKTNGADGVLVNTPIELSYL